MNRNETYSIRQMVELTGLSEFTIRGWENRYSAFNPLRGETGRCRYLKSDIEKAILLRELLKRGHKISKVANLNDKKLLNEFEKYESIIDKKNVEIKPAYVSQVFELIALQKWNELEVIIKEANFKTTTKLIIDFFLPILNTLAEKVSMDLISISQEHVLTSFLKEKIYSELIKIKNKNKKLKTVYRFVLAAPEGDHHELGLLLAHLMVRSHNCTSMYLGPHMPAKDLSETSLRFDATHLLIVSTVSKKGGAKKDFYSYINEVQKNTSANLKILVAGNESGLFKETNPKLVVLKDFSMLDKQLKNLENKND